MFSGFCLIEIEGFPPTNYLMNIENYNIQVLKDYLLSKLSEIEAEKFDELSIIDDDFVETLKSAEDELVDSYISGELDRPDLEKFEINYLASHLRREKVEFARTLQIVARKNLTKTARETISSAGFFASLNIFANFNSAFRLGFAAFALLFVSVLGWFLFDNFNKPVEQAKVQTTPNPEATIKPTQTPISIQPTPIPSVSPKVTTSVEPTNSPTPKPTVEPTKPPTPNVPTLATFLLLPPTRNNSLQTISIPKQTTDVAFGLKLEADDFKNYRVSLKNEAGKILWQSGKLTSKKSALKVRFPAKLLQTKIYSLAVVGIGEDKEPENIGNYSFRSVLK
jgi:hypothetical protein